MHTKRKFTMCRAIGLCFGVMLAVFAQPAISAVGNWSDYSFLGEITSLKKLTTGWQNLVYSGSQVGTTEFLIGSFSHGNPPDDQMIHIYKHKTQGGGWVKVVTAGNDDKGVDIWIREVTSANVNSPGQIETGGAGAVHVGVLAYRGKAVVTDTTAVKQTATTTIAINNNGAAPYLIVAASDNGTAESDLAKVHFAPGDDRVFVYLTNTKAFRDTTTGTLRGAIASLALADSGTQTTVPSVSLAVPAGNVTVNAGTNLYVKVNATDPDGISQVRLYKNGVKLARNESGAPYEWGLASQNDPELKNLTAGSFVLTAEATDTKGTVGKTSVSVTVTVRSANLPPYFTSNPFSKPDATVGVAYNEPFSGKAIDPESGAMTFSKVSGPAWLSVTSGGNATGTPGSADVGTNSFTVKVTDNGGLSATATMLIKVIGPTTPPQTVTFTSIAAEDGYVNESGETTNIGGTLNSTNSAGAGLRIGDMSDKKQAKTILSFDTSSIPDGAVIQSATLKLMRGAVSGTVTNLGQIKVDIKGGTGFNTATALSKEDFQAAADAVGVATMSYPSANGTLSTGGLNATGLSMVNKTGKTQLRVYFATDDDNDGTSDYLGFFPTENGTVANRPVLVITYQ